MNLMLFIGFSAQILDNQSRHIITWLLCTTKQAADVG